MGTTKIYTRTVTGMLVQLPGWRYLVAIDTLTGAVHYDNFNGHWGERRHLDLFLQAYAVEKAKLEARRKGCPTNEVTLQDGSIKLQIMGASLDGDTATTTDSTVKLVLVRRIRWPNGSAVPEIACPTGKGA